jgi:hypothetical protein
MTASPAETRNREHRSRCDSDQRPGNLVHRCDPISPRQACRPDSTDEPAQHVRQARRHRLAGHAPIRQRAGLCPAGCRTGGAEAGRPGLRTAPISPMAKARAASAGPGLTAPPAIGSPAGPHGSFDLARRGTGPLPAATPGGTLGAWTLAGEAHDRDSTPGTGRTHAPGGGPAVQDRLVLRSSLSWSRKPRHRAYRGRLGALHHCRAKALVQRWRLDAGLVGGPRHRLGRQRKHIGGGSGPAQQTMSSSAAARRAVSSPRRQSPSPLGARWHRCAAGALTGRGCR